ncbi:hypothetical protein [Alkalicoccobacillus murimartini]|uniref:hypothetical protein n=1 Tax=Alkalicoccobacillus murimartini TaxID=171685 RepID=UPI0027D926A2|nr:hypothetical protein [Alkalicoccobacillus murimartini]
MNSKYFYLFTGILSVAIGLLASYDSQSLLIFVCFLIYILAIVSFLDEAKFKLVVPYFLLIILFQETIINLMKYVVGDLGNVVSYFDELFILIMLPVIIIKCIIKGEKLRGAKTIIVLITLFLLGFFSGFYNNVSFVKMLEGSLLILKGLLFYIVFVNINYSKDDVIRFFKFSKIAVMIVVIFTVIDLIAPTTLRTVLNARTGLEYRFNSIHTVKSIFVLPAIFAWFTVFVGIYNLVKYKINGENKYLVYCAILFACSLLSFRFKTIIALLFVLILFYFVYSFKKALYSFLPTIIIIGVVSFLFGDIFLNFVDFTFNRYLNAGYMDTARTALYYVSILIANNNFPLGAGFGEFGGYIAVRDYSNLYYQYNLHSIYGLYPEDPKYAMDTYWPNILGETGYLGAILLISTYLALIIGSINKAKKVEDKNIKVLLLFSGLALTQTLVESMGSPTFNSSPQNVFLFATLGLTYSMYLKYNQKNDKTF